MICSHWSDVVISSNCGIIDCILNWKRDAIKDIVEIIKETDLYW